MLKKIVSFRGIFFLSFIITAILLGKAAYLQIDEGLAPCPLCVLTRIMLALLCILFFFGALVPSQKKGKLFFALSGMILSVLGILISGRQVWLQHYPVTDAGECGVNLTYLFKIMPVKEVIWTVWRGGAECSQLGWVFLGFSLAEWALLWFGLFFVVTSLLFFFCFSKKSMTMWC